MIVDERTCQNLREALGWEWLETNGLGGYAASTILNCHTRKYHGLLVATLPDRPGRFVLLSKVEDSLVVGDREFYLSCHRYPGTYFPHGHQYLEQFRQDECPRFRYRIGDIGIEKSILMPDGQNTVLIRYDIRESPVPFTLRLKPFLAFRGMHELRKEDPAMHRETSPADHGFSLQPYPGLPPLFMQTNVRSVFHPDPAWYYNFEFFREAESGYEHHEDLFRPGVIEIPVKAGSVVIVAASLTDQGGLNRRAWDREIARRRATGAADRQQAATLCRDRHQAGRLATLLDAGRRFLITRPTATAARPTVVAGYPWFEDWGRDTLIALPGLTFCAGRPEEGKAILASVGEQECDGLIPNFFAPDPAQHAFNSVDAALWYVWAVQQMLEWTGDLEAVRRIGWPVIQRILRRYAQGTRHGIFMSQDGLLHAGNTVTQLTWMDAAVRGIPVTPRHGYAVEINALWYNALRFADELSDRFGEPRLLHGEVDRLHTAFTKLFWMPEEQALADTFAEGTLDRSIRPNQILAASLPYSPLDNLQKLAVVDVVRRELLTPYGLRTLSPRHPGYRGRYEGDLPTRDAAYHQGTVWPWLLGHYGEAVLKTAANRRQAARTLLEDIEPLLAYAAEGPGLGQVPEIWDGDPPQRPHGCTAQAWSVAELIRLIALCGGGKADR
jgi:predicted glycogen debranching enzyme